MNQECFCLYSSNDSVKSPLSADSIVIELVIVQDFNANANFWTGIHEFKLLCGMTYTVFLNNPINYAVPVLTVMVLMYSTMHQQMFICKSHKSF